MNSVFFVLKNGAKVFGFSVKDDVCLEMVCMIVYVKRAMMRFHVSLNRCASFTV